MPRGPRRTDPLPREPFRIADVETLDTVAIEVGADAAPDRYTSIRFLLESDADAAARHARDKERWARAIEPPSKLCEPAAPADLSPWWHWPGGVQPEYEPIDVDEIRFLRKRPDVSDKAVRGQYVVPALDGDGRAMVLDDAGDWMAVDGDYVIASDGASGQRMKPAEGFPTDEEGALEAALQDAGENPVVPAHDERGRPVVRAEGRVPVPDRNSRNRMAEDMVILPALADYFRLYDDRSSYFRLGAPGWDGVDRYALFERWRRAAQGAERLRIAAMIGERAGEDPEYWHAAVAIMAEAQGGAAVLEYMHIMGDWERDGRSSRKPPHRDETEFAACECLRRYSYPQTDACRLVGRAVGKSERIVNTHVYGKHRTREKKGKPVTVEVDGARLRWLDLIAFEVPPGRRDRVQLWRGLAAPIVTLSGLINTHSAFPGAAGEPIRKAWIGLLDPPGVDPRPYRPREHHPAD